MKITVTASHIRRGKRYNLSQCPIALALKDAGIAPDVEDSQALDENREYFGPRYLDRFINSFDSGFKVKPFSFILKTH